MIKALRTQELAHPRSTFEVGNERLFAMQMLTLFPLFTHIEYGRKSERIIEMSARRLPNGCGSTTGFDTFWRDYVRE